MSIMPFENQPGKRRTLPIDWQQSAWTVPIAAVSVASVSRRDLSRPRTSRLGAPRRHLRRLRSSRRGISTTLVSAVQSPFGGRVSIRRQFTCDSSAMSRLAALASWPLGCNPAPRLRVFRFFQQPQSVL